METMLEVKDLTKEYPGFVLDHVSFSVPKGCIVGLIGENGAGKSTTIHGILDLIHKKEGSVTFCGRELASDISIKEEIGVVFDEINFYETMTPLQIGKISKAAYKSWKEEIYQMYLQKFSLPETKKLKTFSKGMKMKLSIAVALSHQPKLLILDEATSGLDPVMRDDILEVFLDFVQDEEHSILMSSHITTDLEKVADYITFLHEGKVIFSKLKDELRYQYGILRCGKEEFQRIEPKDVIVYRKEAYQCSVLVEDKEAMRKKYPHVVVDDASIDELMLLYIKGEKSR